MVIRFVLYTVGALASTGAPYFIEEPSDTYVEKGKPAVLNCLVGGNTKSAIAWRRNGIALDLSSDGRRMIKPNGSLYFSEIIHDEDEGTYQCEALSSSDMGLDYQILSRTARLIVAGKSNCMFFLFNCIDFVFSHYYWQSTSKVYLTGFFYVCSTWKSLSKKKNNIKLWY